MDINLCCQYLRRMKKSVVNIFCGAILRELCDDNYCELKYCKLKKDSGFGSMKIWMDVTRIHPNTLFIMEKNTHKTPEL